MFSYDPLDPGVDSLRVLILLPTSKSQNGEIECKLENRPFGTKPDYEALSYTWGRQPADKHIKINGQPFAVRENLYNALVHLRQARPRTLWVDAICINQDDVAERNAQVSLMAFVYTRARQVVVWLGPWAEPIRSDGYFSDANWHALSHNHYWTRLWIIQELVLAEQVRFQLGRHVFGWDRVAATDNPEWRALEGRSTAIGRLREERYTSAQRLENLIELFQRAECTEKRDRVYGFLGMVYDGADFEIKVDYEMGFAQLYAQVIGFHQSIAAPQDSPFASDVDRAATLFKFSRLLQKVFEGAVADELKIKPDTTWENTFYTARGRVAGEILALGPTPGEIAGSVRAGKNWRLSFQRVLRDSREQQRARRDYEALSEAMLEWCEDYVEGIKALDSQCYGYQFNDGGPLTSDQAGTLSAPDASGAKLFLATEGLVGVVPAETQVGDLVCTFLGCDSAVVVRKVEGVADLFRLVGPATVQKQQDENVDEDRDMEDALIYDMEGMNLDDEEYENFLTDAGMNLRLDLGSLQKITVFT